MLSRNASALRWHTVALLGLISLATGLHALAQPAGVEKRERYRLSIGDVIEVVVAGEPDLSAPAPAGLEVGPDGRVGCPIVGMISVEGCTCEEAAKLVADGLVGRVLVKPQVLVRVIQYRGPKVNVLGAVRAPGSFPHRPGMSIADAVALAGGVLAKDGQTTLRTQVRIVHNDGRAEMVRLDANLGNRGGQAPYKPRPGDTIVFEIETSVAVLGYVANPGLFAVREDTRVSDIVAQAGGVLVQAISGGSPQIGDLQRVVVNHVDGTVRECNVVKTGTGKVSYDPLVLPGDVVYVPRSARQALVLGYVQMPGKYDYEDGDRVSDLLAHAKGALVGITRGDTSRVILTRADGSVRTLDMSSPVQGKAADEEDPLLAPEDQVAVPELPYRVVVAGYVDAPGTYDYHEGDTVRTAVGMAHGVTKNLGTATAVKVRHRDGKQVVLNLEKENSALQPGDEITVPFAKHRVAVLGYVNNPGVYECEEGQRVVDMIAAAGGTVLSRRGDNYRVEKGDPNRAVLIRRDNGKDSIRELDLTRFFKGGDQTPNPEVRPGDVVYVPNTQRIDASEILRDVLVIPRLFGN